MTALLEIRNLSRSFGGLTALRNVSFNVRQGEILGLIGPNGAGKTTLFNVVNGFFRPSQGAVLFKRQVISGLKPHRICQLGLARTFQILKPLRRMTVLDNLLVAAFLRARTRREAEATAMEVLHFTGLHEARHAVSSGLSLGSRNRLEIARALATGPDMLLLDESFAGLNPAEIDILSGIIREIRKRGLTIMIIEHHTRVIMSICDRIVVLNYGEMIAEGTPEEIRRNRIVIDAYLGEN